MSIELRPKGEAKAAATAGKMIGESEKAKREQAIALEKMQRASQLKAQQMAMDWESEKMLMRSQQEFGVEMRAREWEAEKMAMASQLDFQADEKDRQERIDTQKTILMALDKDTVHSEEAKAPYRAQAEMNLEIAKAGGTGSAPLIREKEGDLFSLLGQDTPTPEPIKGVETVINPKTKEPIYVPENQPFVTVRHPTLGLKKVRREQLQEALADGAIYVPQQNIPEKSKGVFRNLPTGMRALGGSFGGINY